MTIEYHPAVEQDLDNARKFYEKNSLGLGM
jgi:hypothetical protein